MLSKNKISQNQIKDIRSASSKMKGHIRRKFQAEMTIKYSKGNQRLAEELFGWSRNAVKLGLNELRTGFICINIHTAVCGRKLWEHKYPKVAKYLIEIAEKFCQQDPTFNTTLAYSRLTAKAAIEELKKRKFKSESIPSPSSMAVILNRLGYRLKKVVKAKPKKR